MEYRIISDFRINPEKATCGDYLKIVEFDDYVVLVLSDGVGSRHHDYIASKTACDSFCESFVSANGMNFNERFVFALKQADQDVSFPNDPSHKGMMATLVAFVLNVTTREILWDSIGDSRLYLFKNNKLQQISKDSVKAVIMRGRDGKILKKDGVFVIRNGLTNALGYNGAVINPQQLKLTPGDSFILCSDGMYGLPDFEQQIGEMLKLEVSIELLNTFFEKNTKLFDDDSSIIVFQDRTIDNELADKLNKIIKSKTNFLDESIAGHLMSIYISNNLSNALLTENTDISQCVLYLNDYKIRFSEKTVLTMMSEIKEIKNPDKEFAALYRILADMLREIKLNV